jgi:hypothetical protein
MTIFVPRGDADLEDVSRPPHAYDRIAEFLLECGAKLQLATTTSGAPTSGTP